MTLSTWIDPADDDRRTEASGRITAITDAAGNYDVAESGASGPPAGTLVNFKTVLDHGGVAGRSDGLESAGVWDQTGQDITAIVAYTDDGATSGTSDNNLVSAARDGDRGPGWGIGKRFGTSNLTFTLEATNCEVTGGATAFNVDIAVAKYDNVQDFMELIKNGGQLQASVDYAAGFTKNLYQFAVGNYEDMNGGWEYGVIGDVIVFEGAMRYDQIQLCEGFLAHKWDSTGSIPLGHPYKKQPPESDVVSQLLATFEGADAATSYTAEVGGVATFVGNSQLDTQLSKYGGSSLLLDGTGDYITFPDSADWDFGAGDFTIEGWFRFGANNTADTLLAHYNAFGVSQRSWIFRYRGDLATDVLQLTYSTNGTTVSNIDSAAWTPTVGVWYHIAITRQGANVRFFVDGVLLNTDTSISTSALFNVAEVLSIGSAQESGGYTNYFAGSIDSLRIVKGKALYTGPFGPPNRGFKQPLTADLIANFNGPDAAVAYTSEDAGARVATFVGNAQLDTAQKKFGHASLLLDGTGDYLEFPDDAAFTPAGDLSIECWVRFSTVPTNAGFVSHYDSQSGNNRSWIFGKFGGNLRFYTSTDGTVGTIQEVNAAWSPSTATWYHCKVERNGSIVTLWVDGVVIGTGTVTGALFNCTDPLRIGATRGGSGVTDFMNGWIDGVQLVMDKALRTEVEPLDRLFNSAWDTGDLLLNFEGTNAQASYTSDDDNAISLTFLNGAQLSNVQRRRGGTCLDVIAEQDAVQVPAGNGLNPGTSDFTVEFWVLFTSAPGTTSFNAIFDQRTDHTVSQVALYIGTDNGGGRFVFYVSAAPRIISTTVPVINQWYHVVVERVDSITRMYIDGVQEGSDYADTNDYNLNAITTLGSRRDQGASNNSMEGYLDMVRVSVGTAIYNGDFTPPVAGAGEPLHVLNR